ncbi:GtrA family protein [Parasphingorhabdus litoris]|uniref:GtrA family protein n=1 Tax=Parasphingorhabdus litoris TaxID=394733 RepID=UPI0031CF429F
MSSNRNLRYLLAVIVGLVIDLAVSIILRSQFQLSLEVAASVGFLVAVACNYLFFEFWVFENGQASFSISRLLKTYIGAIGVLIVRVVIIFVSGLWIADGALPDLLRLFASIVASFVLNYALLKLVFRRM